MNIYTNTVSARDGNIIVESHGKAMHSSYNPVREGITFAQQIQDNPSYIVIIGIAAAYHIKAVHERFPDAVIIACEADDETLTFVKTLPLVKEISAHENVFFTTCGSLKQVILSTFLPVLHTKFAVVSLRAWQELFPELYQQVQTQIQSALDIVKRDFSVQSHFGLIWQRNFFSNLSLCDGPYKEKIITNPAFDTSKTAAIIAAGPSFDDTYRELLENRSSYVIFATDTANNALLRRGIISDVIISVDAQMISHNHFFSVNEKSLCVFDLCASSCSVRHCLENGNKVSFISSEHPLSSLARSFCVSAFPLVTSGAGTVTIAAVDFASRLGFTGLQFFGADFSYQSGKAYTKGTYLDDLYNLSSSKINSSQKQFTALCYRTPLIKKDENSWSSEVLDSYRESLLTYLADTGWKKEKDNLYKRECKPANNNQKSITENKTGPIFNKEYFVHWYLSLKEKNPDVFKKSLLPLAASLLNRQRFLKESESVDCISLAYSRSLVYTEIS